MKTTSTHQEVAIRREISNLRARLHSILRKKNRRSNRNGYDPETDAALLELDRMIKTLEIRLRNI